MIIQAGFLTYSVFLNLPQSVHHAGQPMPGEEQEDIVMTSMDSNIKNLKCPLTGKPITELTEPVRRYFLVNFKLIFPVKNCNFYILFMF